MHEPGHISPRISRDKAQHCRNMQYLLTVMRLHNYVHPGSPYICHPENVGFLNFLDASKDCSMKQDKELLELFFSLRNS